MSEVLVGEICHGGGGEVQSGGAGAKVEVGVSGQGGVLEEEEG